MIALERRGLTVALTEGRLRIKELRLRTSGRTWTVPWKVDIRGGHRARVDIPGLR